MHPLRPAHLGLLVLLLAGACEPPAPSDTAIRTDSAGVLLVAYPDLPPMEASRIAIAAEPELVLGEGAFTGPDYEFFRIRGVSQLRDGTLVVANQGSHELRFYGADGGFLQSVGREGEGPGEFRSIADLWVMAGDTLVVWDQRTLRLQHFTPDGAFVRATSMSTSPSVAFPWTPSPQAVLENGRVAAFFRSRPRPTNDDPANGIPERPPLLVALYRIDVGAWDSVRVVPGVESIFYTTNGGLRSQPYNFGAYSVTAGAGATMAVADVDHFRVELFDPDGGPVSILSAAVPEIPVTADMIEAEVQLVLDGALPRYEAELRRFVLAGVGRVFLPAIRDVFVDADERIWVERYDVPRSGPSRWEVFAHDGTWIGRVEMPEGLARGSEALFAPAFSIASGRLAGVWTDPDTGVETVRVYRVIEQDS